MPRTKYSVLALDGGGIRGVIPARALEALEQRMRRPVGKLFDMVAGTSTGGIIALGLTKPSMPRGTAPAFAASELLDLYMNLGRTIFPDELVIKVRTLGGLADPRYKAGPLEGLLTDRFGDTKVSEAITELVIPTYDLS